MESGSSSSWFPGWKSPRQQRWYFWKLSVANCSAHLLWLAPLRSLITDHDSPHNDIHTKIEKNYQIYLLFVLLKKIYYYNTNIYVYRKFIYHVLIWKIFGYVRELFAKDNAMEIVFRVFCHVQKVALSLTHDLQFFGTEQGQVISDVNHAINRSSYFMLRKNLQWNIKTCSSLFQPAHFCDGS